MKAAVLFALALGVATPLQAADPAPAANRFAMRIAPAESFDIQGMLVERHGQGGRPLVLVPGLQ